jgi:hypothetical protein
MAAMELLQAGIDRDLAWARIARHSANLLGREPSIERGNPSKNASDKL